MRKSVLCTTEAENLEKINEYTNENKTKENQTFEFTKSSLYTD